MRIQRVAEAVIKTLLVNPRELPADFLEDKLETFLTCLTVSRKLGLRFCGKSLEEAALLWLTHALPKISAYHDFQLLLVELPNILRLDYPAVKALVNLLLEKTKHYLTALQASTTHERYLVLWENIVRLDYLKRLLESVKV